MSPVIGKAIDRVDGRLKVTGGAHYCAEMPIPNLVHAVLINSTITNGRIVEIDTQAAVAAPSVLAVLTHRNAPRIVPSPVALDSASQGGGAGEQHVPLQNDRIHYSGQHIGVVIAETMAYDARFSPTAASAQLFADGNVLVQSATCDQGTGSYTIMRQIAADTLGMPMASIRFELGDTQMPEAPVSAGSKTTSSVGSTVHAATTSLRRKLLDLAFNDPHSPLYGHTEAEVTVDNGRCYLKDIRQC